MADVAVLATGFRTLQFLWPVENRGGSGRTPRERWGQDDARAYLGFQTRHVVEALRHLLTDDVAVVEVREDVFWDHDIELDGALSRSIWSHVDAADYHAWPVGADRALAG